MVRTKEEINKIQGFIDGIVDDYLIDLYGELNDNAKNHQYTLARIKLLMWDAFNKGEQYGKGNTQTDC